MGDSARSDTLAGECRRFTRYLLGEDAAPDVLSAYARGHETSAVEADLVPASLDRALLALASRGLAGTRAADAYGAVFARGSRLRRKLVLLLAILESRAPSAAALDTAEEGSFAAWAAAAAARAGLFVAVLCVAVLVVPPLRLWYRLAGA